MRPGRPQPPRSGRAPATGRPGDGAAIPRRTSASMRGTRTRRTLIGTLAALVTMAALTAAMVTIRGHLSIATAALVLVVPVVIGVVVGGVVAGVLSVVAGFLVYDYFFIPPYATLSVGALQNWVALGVYAVVMLPVAQVVARLDSARAEARRREREMQELFSLSHLLVEDQQLDELLSTVVTTVAGVFEADQVALLLSGANGLEVAASAGEPLSEAQLRRVLPQPPEPASLEPGPSERGGLLVVALVAGNRPVGLLVLTGDRLSRHDREPLMLFANHIALAVERVQLRDRALRARLADEVARLARTLVSAVAHDLRTPLARIKASSSTLADSAFDVDPAKSRRLAGLIDSQVDRLADLVANLLDMSRVQAGVLQPRRSVVEVRELVAAAVRDVAADRPDHPIRVELAGGLPPVDVDRPLVGRVLENLIANALRYSPKSEPITIGAVLEPPGRVLVSVSDHGPGVPAHHRDEIFELFARRDSDAGAGLGLAIARTFVEAHGERIWVEEAPGGGAMFCFTLPLAEPIEKERHDVESARH
jgi:two-component system sensor histidine kinase KdpD